MIIVSFIQRAVMQGIPLLFGSTGEILTEKSGHLNLGIPGIMYVGAISGVIGAFFYENSVGSANIVPLLAVIIALLSSMFGSLVMGLIYCLLTVTLRANQNVTGLALTTFGVGFGNFFGGSLIKISGSDMPSITLSATSNAFRTELPFAHKLGAVGELLFSYSFLAYVAIIIALVSAYILNHTRVGLHLRAVGENPATADAAGINVNRYKYVTTCIGSVIAGLGGLYYIMDYANGIWSNNGFGDRGWLAVAIVIFAIWRPNMAVLASILFGGLFIVHNYITIPGLGVEGQELFKMIPYVVTLIVLIVTSMRDNRETQPPEALGLPYFREER
ncbi:MAG: ABC transporter permease [Oscillospiraceae bacterium]|nr:ABC transporter permease [Oscillospiraceae bacterium]